MNDNNINDSVLTREVIGYTPRWITRWGITVILLVFITVITVLSSINYPVSEVVPGKIEYEVKPALLISPDNSVLKEKYVDHGFVEQGDKIMLLENIVDKKLSKIEAPVSGDLYLSDNWKIASFINNKENLGFIVPQPNSHILKVELSSEKFRNLSIGQSIAIKIKTYKQEYSDIHGTIAFIGHEVSGKFRVIIIKFSQEIDNYLFSHPLIGISASIDCTVNFPTDTTTYLKYLFHRVKK